MFVAMRAMVAEKVKKVATLVGGEECDGGAGGGDGGGWWDNGGVSGHDG